MSTAQAAQRSQGIGCFGVLAIIFIVLKLTGLINWSWWLVLLPVYGGIVIVVVAILLIFLAHLALAGKR